MKYIDADKLKRFVQSIGLIPQKQADYNDGRDEMKMMVLDFIDSLQQEQDILVINKKDWEAQEKFRKNKDFGKYLQQEQLEIDLNDFMQKMDDWKARYNHPDNIPIKATMAFTARMFYMYPNVARQWYDSLPKATMD